MLKKLRMWKTIHLIIFSCYATAEQSIPDHYQILVSRIRNLIAYLSCFLSLLRYAKKIILLVYFT